MKNVYPNYRYRQYKTILMLIFGWHLPHVVYLIVPVHLQNRWKLLENWSFFHFEFRHKSFKTMKTFSILSNRFVLCEGGKTIKVYLCELMIEPRRLISDLPRINWPLAFDTFYDNWHHNLWNYMELEKKENSLL